MAALDTALFKSLQASSLETTVSEELAKLIKSLPDTHHCHRRTVHDRGNRIDQVILFPYNGVKSSVIGIVVPLGKGG